MTKIGIGLSTLSDSSKAAKAALNQALQTADATPETIQKSLIMLFLTENYDYCQVLNQIKSVITTDNIIGSTSAGVFCNRISAMNGIVIGIFKSDELSFSLAAEEGISVDETKAGFNLGSKLIDKIHEVKDTNYITILLLADGMTNSISLLIDSLFDKLGSNVRYAGGGSGDNLRFLKTLQFHRDKALNDSVVSALIASKKPIGIGTSHGWLPISPPLVVTNSDFNQVRELDWQNAFDVYSKIVRAYGKTEINENNCKEILMSFPLGIPQSSEEYYIIRDPVLKKPDGTMIFVGDVPNNSIVRVMYGDMESLMSSPIIATLEAFKQLGGCKPAGVLVFYSISRCLLLQDAFHEEIAAINDLVGTDVPVFGCMTYGEIGSLYAGPPAFHNKSLVVCIFPE